MESSAELSAELSNRLSEIAALAEAVQRFLGAFRVPAATVFQVNLVLDELLTNVISYGYSDACVHLIRVGIGVKEGRIEIRIEDDAGEFDPFAQPPVDTTANLEQRDPGGLGIHLVKEMMEGFDYRRLDDRNHVVLHRSFLAADGSGPEESKEREA